MLPFKFRRCPRRAFTMMHPPPHGHSVKSTSDRQPLGKSKTDESPGGPYLGIVSSRYIPCVMCLEDNDGKKEQSSGGTDLKISTQNLFTNAMEIFWSGIRQKAWTMFHPPPSLK